MADISLKPGQLLTGSLFSEPMRVETVRPHGNDSWMVGLVGTETERFRYVRDYVIWLKFRDGTAGEVDLGPELCGEVFEPLRDPAYFKQFTVHPEFHTLVWPNDADFAPEFLHDAVRVTT